ncbi:MAG: 30S ribosomal protein S6 [Lachnospiraceae bacterium]|nr:30S ribosomal protein S6 [Candidatus Equihabitans merdae]
MNEYELAVVVSAKVTDDVRAAVIDKCKGYIARFGGEVSDVEEWGKRKLAYPIQKMDEGYYYFVSFKSDSDCPNHLEKEMRIMENVLRYLVVRKDEYDFHMAPAAEEKVEEAAPVAEEAAEEAPAEAAE